MNEQIPYIAHIAEDGTVQTVKEHCENTAALSREFAVDPLKDLCYAMGLYHDIGKYQPGFQRRIRGENVTIEHANCGAIELKKLGKNNLAGIAAALCAMGHHSGLPDCGTMLDISDRPTLNGRLCRQTEDYSAYKNELAVPTLNADALNSLLKANCKSKEELVESYAFLVRYCFSCLTDADTIDTMRAMKNPPPPALSVKFDHCGVVMAAKIHEFCRNEVRRRTPLGTARHHLSRQAWQNSEENAEIYLMNMPTGSGKTLAGLRCALNRRWKGNKKRIIYIIPYNSIIDQTAQQFESMFDERLAPILRHQSTFSYEDREDIGEDYRSSAIYACENWDAQLIITTAVQFFESIYSNKRGKLRKLHNMADSILVFDEAHMMPIEYLQPCLRAVAHVTRYLNSEAIFMTATMPDFERMIHRYAFSDSRIKDLVPDKSDFAVFKNKRYSSLGKVGDEQLLASASAYASALLVVNSRKSARRLFEKAQGKAFHLSTYMTAHDRTIVIEQIRTELKQLQVDFPDGEVPTERRITVVATSLIEAGVDLDFTVAYRELMGLDNLLQTGGRCNREGKQTCADVFVFEFEDNTKAHKPEQSILLGILRDFEDVSSPEAITAYYDRLFEAKKDEITAHSLSASCGKPDLIPFSSYSLHMIDSPTVSIVVPVNEESDSLIRTLLAGGKANTRRLQKYCCTVYRWELEQLEQQGVVKTMDNGITVLLNRDYYSDQTGIQFTGKDIFI